MIPDLEIKTKIATICSSINLITHVTMAYHWNIGILKITNAREMDEIFSDQLDEYALSMQMRETSIYDLASKFKEKIIVPEVDL